MAILRFSPSKLVAAPLKVLFLASLPLVAGIEFGDRAAADPQGITNALQPQTEGPVDLTTDTTFKMALSEGYRALAEVLEENAADGNSSSDWADSQYFMLRAMAAARGDDEGPEQLSNWAITDRDANAFLQARSDILAAREQVEIGGAHATSDALLALAEAQINFDCWIERSEERFATRAAKDCREAVEDALERYEDAIEKAN